MTALTLQPLRPYTTFTNKDGSLTVQGYDFLHGLFLRVGGSLSDLNAATLLDKTWAEPDPIGSVTPSTGKFTTLQAIDLTVTNNMNITGGSFNLTPANQTVTIAPTGTGDVRIVSAGTGSMDNLIIGSINPAAITGTNIVATFTLSSAGQFGVNGATPRSSAATGAVLSAYAAGANGLAVAADMQALVLKVKAIDAALKANGICS